MIRPLINERWRGIRFNRADDLFVIWIIYQQINTRSFSWMHTHTVINIIRNTSSPLKNACSVELWLQQAIPVSVFCEQTGIFLIKKKHFIHLTERSHRDLAALTPDLLKDFL